jgi:tripartite-type tricarboxylate transporter receptor subunit TctC
MPELPTIAESGGTKSTGDVWYGLFTRAGTPEAVVSRVNDASVQVLRQPELIDVLRKAGFEPGSSTPAALAAQLRNDVEKWGRVAKAANLNKE